MPSGPDDLGKILVIVKSAGVGGRAAVTQKKCACVTFSLSLGDRLVEFDSPVWAETDMAVRVDETGHDPATVEDSLGAIDRFTAQDAVDDPELGALTVG